MAAPSISTYILSNSSHYYGSEGGAAVMTSPSDSVTKVSAIISQTSGGAAIETVETTVRTSSDQFADRWALTWPTAGIASSPYYVRMWATNSDGDGAVREVAPYIYFPPSVSVTSPANGSTLTDGSVTMAWTATDDYGISYQRASVSHDGTELWGAEVGGNSIAVPSSVVFESGESYSFSVTARNGKGMESTATSTVSFSFVAPAAPVLAIAEGDGKSASIKVTYGEDMLATNLSPYFSQDITDVYNASTNPDGYWFWFSAEAAYTQKDDGWVHVAYSNTGGSAVYPNFIVQQVPALENGATYTFLVEIANATISGDVKFSPNGSSGSTVAHLNNVTAFSIANNSTYYKSTTAKSSFSGCNRFTRSYFNVPAGGSISLDLRISIYKGAYDGDYVPYGLPATDSVDIIRVNADGSTWAVATGLGDGDTATDPLPPLGVDAVYKAVGKTSAGGMSEKLYMHGIPTTGWVLNFGDAAQETVGFIYNPQATMTLAQGGESYHFADGGMGGGLPVFYPTTDRDASGTLAFDTVLYGDSDRLLDLCRRYPVAWLRDPFGHRWRAHVRPSVSHGVGQVWPVTIAWDAVRFEEV